MSNWDDIDSLREQVNENAEEIMNLRAQRDQLKRMLERLQRPMDDAAMNRVALEAARKIEDIFAQGHVGGVAQRVSKVQIEIREVLRETLTGTRHWSHGGEQNAV